MRYQPISALLSIVTEEYTPPRHVVPVIVIAQFLCTSLWFAGNAVVAEMADSFGFDVRTEGYLTIAVTLGFIVGTLVFAFLSLSDRFSPGRVFLLSAIAGAATNLLLMLEANSFWSVLIWRFATGVCLAGIYPVGMKIASDYHRKGLGRALGYLVGALVLGTALPHGIRAITAGAGLQWQAVVITTSVLSVAGGVLLYSTVPDGPFRKAARILDLSVVFRLFSHRDFRAAATGYFGHMWELYAFWTFVPLMLMSLDTAVNVSAWAFAIIGIGGLSCVAGGYLSLLYGSAKVAYAALIVSGMCCLASIGLPEMGVSVAIPFLLLWGIAVIMDSPQFSTLVAQTAPSENSGTALTIVNCIGFTITMISIQVMTLLIGQYDPGWVYWVLVFGPVGGLLGMARLVR